MKLSIITVNRNNAAGLERTLNSVLPQTFNDFEHIIVDGASDDDSVEIIKRYEKESSLSTLKTPHPIRWISERDKGVFDAMNKGIAMAEGEYLLFLNSGDWLVSEDVLEKVFAENPIADVYYCQENVINNGKVWVSDIPEDLTFGFFYKSTLMHQSTFMKKSLFDEYGLYREDLKIMGDWEFWLRSIILGNATAKKSSIVVSNYVEDGISATNPELEIKEKNLVYQQFPLRYFVPDYRKYEKELQRGESVRWFCGKRFFMRIVDFLYGIARKISGK